MMNRCWLLAFMLAVLALALPEKAEAQTVLFRQVIGSGATAASSPEHLLLGTIGQTIIGRVTSSTHTGALGFWYTYPHAYTTSVREEYIANSFGSAGAIQVAPNPVVDETRISVTIPAAGDVTLKVYDNLGRERLTLIDGSRPAGTIALQLNARNLPTGDYVLVLFTGGARSVAPLRVLN
jgi:hypothetical protein